MYTFCQSNIDNTIFMCYTEYIMDDQQPSFDTTILRKAGLTESQAKGYLALIEHGSLSPVELAEKTSETRTNGYMICDKLEKLGLAIKKKGQKALYTPAHPSALEALAEKRRKAIPRAETDIKQGIDPLINMFYAATEMPGARTLQGVDGIKTLYQEVLLENKDVYLIRTRADNAHLGYEYIYDHRLKRAKLGIQTYALTPFTVRAHDNSANDAKLLFSRRWYAADNYTAPVEIQIFGTKIALIAYGQDQMVTILQSPPIAEAMRQLFNLLVQFLPSNEQVISAHTHTG